MTPSLLPYNKEMMSPTDRGPQKVISHSDLSADDRLADGGGPCRVRGCGSRVNELCSSSLTNKESHVVLRKKDRGWRASERQRSPLPFMSPSRTVTYESCDCEQWSGRDTSSRSLRRARLAIHLSYDTRRSIPHLGKALTSSGDRVLPSVRALATSLAALIVFLDRPPSGQSKDCQPRLSFKKPAHQTV